MPADVAGPVARRVTGAAAQAPFSAAPIMNRAKKTQAQIGDAVDRVVARHDGEVLARR
jgi:hypothetical protein